MTLKHIILTLAAAAIPAAGTAATFSLDSCRALALAHNRKLAVSTQRIVTADYQRRQAWAAYLPAIDFQGVYAHNSKDIAIFGSDQLLPTKTFNPATGTYDFNLVMNPATGKPVTTADGHPIPSTVALIPKESMTYDVSNVFFGAVTLTQPIYMGGKIRALNRLAGYAGDLAQAQRDAQAQDVIYAVDQAYWQVVSLQAKRRLAASYVALLDTLNRNVAAMLGQGVATRADKLSVEVKLNTARVDLTKVDNGLSLSRMALAQVCGLPIDSDMQPVDEPGGTPLCRATAADTTGVSAEVLDAAYQRRPDLRALRAGIDIAGQQKRVAMAEMLPKVALVGGYSFSNPNMFDGFSKRFSGMWSIGAMVSIPIWHWGGNYYKYKAAESDETVMRLRLDDSRTLVDLQINQAAFKASESVRTYAATRDNLASADENLRCANLGFKEGVISLEKVMEAQTAWLKANSECVDAMIDVQLCDAYLGKVLGTLTNPPNDPFYK